MPSTVRALFAAFVISVLASTSFAQHAKVLAPHRHIPPLIPQSQQQPLPPTKPGSLAGGFWMTDPNTHSTLYLRNVVDIAPVTVNPILFLSNGNKYPLPAVTLDPSGTAIIDINAALQNLGIASYSTLSGYVELDYNWPWVPLCATIRVVDPIHSTIFTYGVPPSTSNQTATNNQPTSLLGMWWKYDSNVTGFVSLANRSSQTIAAAVAVTDAQGTVLGTHKANVSPNGTKIISLPELQQTNVTEGGLQVSYSGTAGALDVNGGIEDQGIGYSASLRFAPAASGTSALNTVAAVGVMAGAADPMMLFPAGTTFTPYTVVRNVSNTAISVSPTLWWMQGGIASSYALGSLTIAPGQVQRLNLTSGLSAAGLSTFSGSITLELGMQGPQGSLLVQAGSVDQTGTYVFEVMPHGVQESASKSIGYWSTANGDDTMVSIWNPADEAQDFVFRLVFSGGNYLYPIHLAPRATQSFNISQLIQAQVPDSQGNIIPSSIQAGSAVLGGAQGDVQHILVALDSGTYNVRKATCGVNCVYCDGYTAFSMVPGSATFAVQATKQYQFIGTYSSGSQYNVAGPWSSSKTTVATVSSSTGVATGVAGGTANFITSFDEPIYQGNVCTGGTYSCAFASGTPSGGGNIVQITNVYPSQITLGTSGPMTITGTNFNFLSSPVTVSTNGGVLIGSAIVQNSTTITATYDATNCSIAVGPQNLWISGPTTDGGSMQTLPWPITVNPPQLPAPGITFGGTTVTGSTQSVVVGQQIALGRSIPSLPACGGSAVTSDIWSIPGTVVGGYNASSSSGSVVPPILSNPSATIYWAYPGQSLQVQYSYCTNASFCSSAARATFNVAGPSVSSMSTPTGTVNVFAGPVLGFGPVGITFTPTVTAPSGGQFEWVQLITNDTLTLTTTAGIVKTCVNVTQPPTSGGTGLDTGYPFAKGTSTKDSPSVALDSSTYNKEARSFSAKMYFLWDPALPSGCTVGSSCTSIPVPLGSVTWGFSGTASYSSGNWSLTASSKTTPSWAPGTTYPSWSDLVPYNGQLSCH